MKKILIFLGILYSLLTGSASAQPYNPAIYIPGVGGPCDLVVCAEAYSVTRAMTNGYAGPLFQLNNGSSTLNIGQVNHKVDMSTWSAFCSGVASNCTISKVYAQIHTTSNDLVPFNAGTAHQSVFTIEAATGLPIWISSNTTVAATAGQAYTVGGASDSAATGVNALGASESILLNVAPVEIPNGWVGGMFSTDHVYTACAPCTPGTDFGLYVAWGNVGPASCGPSAYCAGFDAECCYTPNVSYNTSIYSMTKFPGAVAVASYDSVSKLTPVYVNGFQMSNLTMNCNAGSSPACTFNPGQRIHYGGGGDLTGPVLVEAREMLITNSALSQAQVTAIFNNTKAFYPGVNFPSGPNNPATYASGPGDVVPGAKYFNGFRAYTAAIAAAGTQQLISVRNNTAPTHTCGVLVNAAGGLGNTTGCSFGGDNGQPVFSFCTSPAQDAGNDCDVLAVQDQVGNVANYINIGTPGVAFMPYCINFTPCAVFSSAGVLGATITLTSVAQPYTFVAIGERSDSTAAMYLATHETGAANPGFQVGWNASANSVFELTTAGSLGPAATAADNAFHAFNFIFNGASSSIIVDGTSTGGTTGADAAAANPSIRWGNSSIANNPLHGQIAETGLYPFALTGTQQTNLRANQRAYWGF